MFNVYLIENKLSHEQYVGMTSRSPKVRFNEHCYKKNSRISKALNKTNKKNFTLRTIASTPNYKLALFHELKAMCYLKSFAPNGYNIRCVGKASSFLLAQSYGQLCFNF